MSAMTAQKEILTAQEVADLLGFHIRTIQRKTDEGVFKCHVFEGRRFYNYMEIKKLIFGETETQGEQNNL